LQRRQSKWPLQPNIISAFYKGLNMLVIIAVRAADA
jgi:hypothetical protein